MKPPFRVRAPGKLILCGEYAVLKGVPCLCVAVARRAYADVTAAESFTLRALGHGPLGVTRTATTVDFIPAPADAAPLELVRQVLARAGDLPAAHVHLDSSEMSSTPVEGHAALKLGLGSSASAAVALTGALHALRDGPLVPRAVFVDAQHAHLAMQGGRGSGVDVAAAAFGGAFVYTRPDADPAHARVDVLDVQRLGVVPVVAWTGNSASTVKLLEQVDAFEKSRPADARRRFDAMAAVATRAADASRTGDAGTLLDALHAYGAEMEALGRDAGADIVTAEHARVRSVAQALGCSAKPSGAGGGDIAVAVARDADRAEALRRALVDAGFTVVPLPWDLDGVHVEPGASVI